MTPLCPLPCGPLPTTTTMEHQKNQRCCLSCYARGKRSWPAEKTLSTGPNLIDCVDELVIRAITAPIGGPRATVFVCLHGSSFHVVIGVVPVYDPERKLYVPHYSHHSPLVGLYLPTRWAWMISRTWTPTVVPRECPVTMVARKAIDDPNRIVVITIALAGPPVVCHKSTWVGRTAQRSTTLVWSVHIFVVRTNKRALTTGDIINIKNRSKAFCKHN
jgi:hypothetical protein